MSKLTKEALRFQRRRNRSKRSLNSDLTRPRLVVFRSARHIYGQIIDDLKGQTLAACSTVEKSVQEQIQTAHSKIEKSQLVGQELAKRALAKNIKDIIFDRNGFIYHGRVKAFADGAREGGLNF
ncbi:MAG: 50S ribosomal protein L18 [Candidatus Neomarinimicrobiota bacterium]